MQTADLGILRYDAGSGIRIYKPQMGILKFKIDIVKWIVDMVVS